MDTLRLLENTDLDIFQEVRSLLLSSFDVKCHHPTESYHLFLCQFVLWMRWQSFIEKMLLQIKKYKHPCKQNYLRECQFL